jgi:two-component system OmpR family response regulator
LRLLLVEDDIQLATRLGGRLREAGFAVDVANCYEQGEDWPDLDKIAAVVLDLNLPDGTGMDLLKLWRRRGYRLPVVILTARGSWQEKVEGLNAGADDFVVKPVRFEELQARLHAVLRRQAARRKLDRRDGLRLDPVAAKSRDGAPHAFAHGVQAVAYLHASPGQVLDQNAIMEHIYDLDSERQSNAVEVLISRLRRKIGLKRIETVRGLGYRFVA